MLYIEPTTHRASLSEQFGDMLSEIVGYMNDAKAKYYLSRFERGLKESETANGHDPG